MRCSEERSDELKMHIYEISTAVPGTSVSDVAAVVSIAVSYADNTTRVTFCFAHRSSVLVDEFGGVSRERSDLEPPSER